MRQVIPKGLIVLLVMRMCGRTGNRQRVTGAVARTCIKFGRFLLMP